MNNKYYIGLDVGTNSVGWAVTDEEYNLKKLKGKHAWGARIFSEAKDKKERRMFRSSRRRIARRKYRIKLLNELFVEEINKIDNTFFLRLDNSSYLFEDKKNKGISRNLIFKTREEEINFYKLYPTIWHLRKALVDNNINAINDLRLVYLAIHNIIKYRGNFLLEGKFDVSKFDDSKIEAINQFFVNKDDERDDSSVEEYISKASSEKLIEILTNDENKKTKQKVILQLFTIGNYKKYIEMFASIVTGGSYSLKKIDSSYEGEIDFSKASFDENVDSIAQTLGDDFELVRLAKEIYDYVLLKKLIGDETSISNVMVKIYEDHKYDLKKLKEIIINIDNNRKVSKEEDRLYYQVFKDKNSEVNYSSFVHNNTNKERPEIDELNKYLEKILLDNETYVNKEYKEAYDELVNKAKNRVLLKIIANESTSIIPHQLHLMELEAIIDNCGNKYSFLKENKKKIIDLFTFRVPYYYGPLDTRSPYSNVERNSNEKITPWNRSYLVNDNETRAKFMRRLTNSCSYLYNEKVMPKTSLDFEEYLILDRLNVMLVNGNNLSHEEKEKVYNFLLSRSKTTIEQLRKELAKIKDTKLADVLISNIKEDIPFEARSHAHLSSCFDIEKRRDEVEYYIFLATVYADDKKALKDFLNNNYPNLLENEIKCILTIPTKKWATISHALLNNVRYIDDAGRAISILEVMKETNKNFQMVLNDEEYGFNDLIKRENYSEKDNETLVKEILEFVPSITRRSIHQSLLIIEDIIKASKTEPNKIFVEVSRDDDKAKKGKETTSREKELNDFINALIKDAKSKEFNNMNDLKDELATIEKIKLKSRHIYLYFKQMGLDLYTGMKIKLEDVINSTKYDLDHIIPQSLIKDDSLDNLVLVDRDYNQKIKKDYYPIPYQIKTESVIKIWRYLREKGAISEKKFNNLMRASEISLEEIENFVARQINIVDYSNITLRNILNIKYPNTKVIFSKSKYPSYIRKELEIIKNRDVNDAHHAVDAYLNVVSGDILSTKFSNVREIYAKKARGEKNATFNMENVLEYKLKQNEKELAKKIVKVCLKRDPLITFKVDYNNGAFYDQTINKHKEKNLIPLHTKKDNPMVDTSKYGGYSSFKKSYILAIKYEEKGKTKKMLVSVPIMYDRVYGHDINLLLEKVFVNPKAKNVEIIQRIHLNQKIKYANCEFLLYTKGEGKNKYKLSYQNYISNDYLKYLNFANKKIDEINEELEVQVFIKNRKEEKIVISKEKNIELLNEFLSIANKKIYDECTYICKFRRLDKEKFINLSLKNQIVFLNNAIKLFSRKSETATFDKIFTELPTDKFLIKTPNISNEYIKIIYESPTGLYSHEVDI